MKQKIALFFVVFSILYSSGQVFNDITKPSLSRTSLAEKIYLQVDNTLYQTGETVWYKAVVVKSYDNSLSDLSGILHVDLIDANENIIQSQLLKLVNGASNGSFVLENSYKPGKYRIRAYTYWNRNFEEDFMFSKAIEVVNLQEDIKRQKAIINVVVGTGNYKSIQADINPKILNKDFKGELKVCLETATTIDSLTLEQNEEGIYKLDHILPETVTKAEIKLKVKSKNKFIDTGDDIYTETIIVDNDYVDLQFFPEGGKLVSGLLSTVGFKALDYNGLGYQVNGVIKDNNNVEITSFRSNALGMGTFKLQPKAGMSYYALIKKDETTYKYSLPNVYFKSSVITIVDLQDQLRLSVSSKNEESKYLIIDVSSRSVKYQRFRFDKTSNINTAIPKESLPDGIIKITVRNDKDQILCERLVFNNRDEQRLYISLSSDKTNYSQREKVRVQVGLDSIYVNKGTTISALVINKKRRDASEKHTSNILAHLLLNSELKGFIEYPDYYFENSNRTRKLDLDALLLTQGWRNYIYENEKPLVSFTFKPEKHLQLSGTIGEYFNPNKRPNKPLDINLMVSGDNNPIFYNEEIASTGHYSFQIDDIYKTTSEYFMQVVDKKGKPIDFKINVDKKWFPAVTQKKYNFKILANIQQSITKEIEAANKAIKDFEDTYSNTVALREVNVKGYKLTPKREEFIEKHGEPTKVINGKDLVEKAPKWNFGVLSVIRSKFPDKVMIIDEGPPHSQFLRPVVRGTEYAGGFTYVLVDNIPVAIREYPFIQSIPVEEVESIDILESPRNKNKYCDEVLRAHTCPTYVALINIYTKSGNGINGIVKTKGAKIDVIKGFSKSVDFYAPNYDTLSNQDWVIPDNRSVIHWEPDIKLNDEGKYYLEFYNDDYIGEVSVIVEAISKDGKIGYVEKTYTVKEAER
ncbi:MG2 domain-containing protein [Winogradskyella algicola]|uniref:MG2 domain-containing protein n=1 Tax=Winogradskyella algicola TaxID=2575815 RepID=UPI00110856B9|nr:MG2 domain-containing protein [Winogradskyella algicola]